MTTGAGISTDIEKSAGNGSRALLSIAVTSKNPKFDRNLTNVSENLAKFIQKPLLLRRLSSAAAVTRSFLQSNDLFLPPSQSLHLESLLSSLPISTPPTTATWFHRFLTSAVEDDDPRWYLYFRMSRSNFFDLFSILSPSLPSLAATIFRLAHSASYESLIHRFGFDSTSEASRAFFTICKLMIEKLGQIYDPGPDYSPRLLPNCCGVLGFGKFEVEGKVLGANGSLIVQAIVDSNGRFVNISAGWPSTMNLESIFRQTKVYLNVEEEESGSFLNGDPIEISDGVLVPRYILGNSCLPLLPWLLTPYDQSPSNEEEEENGLDSSCHREFNSVVYSALHTVEIAFARVRARWRILDRKWKPETIEFLPFVITTGCLLNNFLVNSGDDGGCLLPEDMVNFAVGNLGEMRKAEEEEDEEEKMRRSEGEAFIEAKKIRDAIAENLSCVS